MRRVLYITVLIYPPLLLTALVVLFSEFRQDELGPPLFRALFLIWVIDGFICLVSGIGVMRQVLAGMFSRARASWYVLLSLLAIIIGLPPAYILVDLVYKAALFILARPPGP